MPELPEVETVVSGLRQHLEGARFLDCECRRDAIRDPIPPLFAQYCVDAVVRSVKRRGKYILLDIDHDRTIVLHLGMSGKILYIPGGIDEPYHPLKHDHIIWTMQDARLIFNDPRRFGRADMLPTAEIEKAPYIASLGPEPLNNAWTANILQAALKKTSRPIKNAIMDAGVVVGVGNIYASESLHSARIHPLCSSRALSTAQVAMLHQAVITTLEAAIAAGGSTLRDYVRSSGDAGYFQHSFHVYGREHQACTTCSTPIQKIVMAGRSTFFCPVCQPIQA